MAKLQQYPRLSGGVIVVFGLGILYFGAITLYPVTSLSEVITPRIASKLLYLGVALSIIGLLRMFIGRAAINVFSKFSTSMFSFILVMAVAGLSLIITEFLKLQFILGTD